MDAVMSSDQSRRAELEAAVFRAVDKLNELLPEDQQVAKDRAAILIDEGTNLDSLSVINLLVFIEDEISGALGIELSLTGEDDSVALPGEALRTLGNLVDAIDDIVSASD
jgi:acyl carrier protein